LLSTKTNLDARMLEVIRTRWHTPALERAAAGYSKLGEHGALWLAIGGAGGALDRERRASWRSAAATVAGTYVLNTAIKLVVRRRRPQLPGLPALTSTPTALSFPSAHTATGFAGAFAYSRLGIPRTVVYALAVSLALSRLYLGVHYPSDILAGALLGTAVAAARGAGTS
jgi:membrane-associated phospholipid phosphatase